MYENVLGIELSYKTYNLLNKLLLRDRIFNPIKIFEGCPLEKYV